MDGSRSWYLLLFPRCQVSLISTTLELDDSDSFNSMTQPEPSIPNFMSLSEKPEFVSADSILSFLSLAQLYPIPPPTEMSSNYEQSPLFRVLLRFHFSQNGKLADIHNHNNLHTRQPQHKMNTANCKSEVKRRKE